MKHHLFVLPLLFLASCATVTRGVHEKLRVESDPSGANVQLSTGETGVTPTHFVKKRRTENFSVTVSKTGYITETVKVVSKYSGTGGAAMAGNVILGGAIGIGVDAATGAYNSLYPNPVSVKLFPTTKAGRKAREEAAAQKAREEAAAARAKTVPKPTPAPRTLSVRPKPSPTPARR